MKNAPAGGGGVITHGGDIFKGDATNKGGEIGEVNI